MGRMSMIVALAVMAATVTHTRGQTTVQGNVIDTTGAPIAGVRVVLETEGDTAYTDSLGEFVITVGGTRVAPAPPTVVQTPSVHMTDGRLTIHAPSAGVYALAVEDIAGRSVVAVPPTRVSVGSHRLDLTGHIKAPGLYVLHLHSSWGEASMRLLGLRRQGKLVYELPQRLQNAGPHAKALAVDSLRVGKRGFLPVTQSVDTFPSTHADIVLQADAIEWRVDSLLALMTNDEKAGQMLQADMDAVLDSGHVHDLMLGSIIAAVATSESRMASTWADRSDALQAEAATTRLGIPLLEGTDAVHGHNNCKDAVIFPHNVGLGCIQDPSLIERAGEITALEAAATGVNWTFGPCIAVARNEQWGRTYESFGETPELAEIMGAAAVQGLQQAGTFADGAIAACAKHYLADGGTVWGTGKNGGIDQGNAPLSVAEMHEIHLPGYVAAVRQGLYTVMCSYSSWSKPDTIHDEDMHGSYYWLTTVLKKQLGYDGLVITDCNGHSTIVMQSSVPDTLREQIRVTINAGVDMLMGCRAYQANLSRLKELINGGQIPMARVDDAVRRILRVKYRLGLFDHATVDRALTAEVGSAAHRQAARECTQASCVLLKNEGSVLPLAKSGQHIGVAGFHADSIALLCGGWSMGWGTMVEPTTGTTILDGIQSLVDNAGSVTVSRNGNDLGAADICVVVSGEMPSAEWQGDTQAPTLPIWTRTMIDNCDATGKPVVLVLISGRPLDLLGYEDKCDAIVAAWLPGTEADGVADVLFGDVSPTGKLGHTWPRNTAQLPINQGDASYDPLYPYGYGLTY